MLNLVNVVNKTSNQSLELEKIYQLTESKLIKSTIIFKRELTQKKESKFQVKTKWELRIFRIYYIHRNKIKNLIKFF